MSNPFDKLSSEEIINIALVMDLPGLIAFCRSDRRINRIVCQDTPTSRFWISKLIQDYDIYWVDIRNKRDTTPKQFYEMISFLIREYRRPLYAAFFPEEERQDRLGFSGNDSLEYAVSQFENTRDLKFLTLIDYIIDHWYTPINIDIPLGLNVPEERPYLSLNAGILRSLAQTRDRELVMYMLRRMNEENITIKSPDPDLTELFPVLTRNFKNDNEIVDLILNRIPDREERESLMYYIENDLQEILDYPRGEDQ
jgi:hypothetical protein